MLPAYAATLTAYVISKALTICGEQICFGQNLFAKRLLVTAPAKGVCIIQIQNVTFCPASIGQTPLWGPLLLPELDGKRARCILTAALMDIGRKSRLQVWFVGLGCITAHSQRFVPLLFCSVCMYAYMYVQTRVRLVF